MKRLLVTALLLVLAIQLKATTWYASPTGSGTGTLASPFALNTALNSSSILPGDILYLRGGTYKGRFISNLVGLSDNNITVMSYPNEWAVLDGNIKPATSTNIQVLTVFGGNVTFRDFEITYSNVIRQATTTGFVYCGGVSHETGEDCSFINLIVHETPGDAFHSWKLTGGTLIYGCMIYNNGYVQNIDGRMHHGPGFYVQNQSDDKLRILKDNIVFNNFSVGFEVWSATKNATFEYVKNIKLEGNVAFNAGSPYLSSPSSRGDNNMLVKTADTTGLNVVKNIQILKNVLYHNTDYATGPGTLYEGNSLEVGADDWRYPSTNIMINDNFISGRNSGVRLLELGLTEFTNNYVMGRYVNYRDTNTQARISANWGFDTNKYFTDNGLAFRKVTVGGSAVGDSSLPTWQTTNNIDLGSTRSSFYFGSTPPINVLRVKRNEYNRNRYIIALLGGTGVGTVALNFANHYFIPQGTNYSIRDIESYTTVASSGAMPANSTINFSLNLTTPAFLAPTGSDFTSASARTPDTFGVFYVDIDPFFYPNNRVWSTKLQADGKIIFVGEFTNVNGYNSNRIARLNSNMTFDTTFMIGTGANDAILATAIQSDGKILIGGRFTSYNGSTRNGIARLNSNGTIDTGFTVGMGLSSLGYVNSIAIQADGKIVIGGNFTTYNGTARVHIARLNSNGTLDTTFASGFSTSTANQVSAVAIQSDGKIVASGSFSSYASIARSNIVRLITTGANDATYNIGTGFNNGAGCLKLQSDGKLLVGGSFTTFNGTSRKYITRLNTDGTLDTAFVPDVISFPAGGSGVKAIEMQSDGKIFIGGGFKTVGGLGRNMVARLNASGTVDSSFDEGSGFSPAIGFQSIAANINALAIQIDGKVVAGGNFDGYNGVGVDNITRINPNVIGGLGRGITSENGEDNNAKVTEDFSKSIVLYPNPAMDYFKVFSQKIHVDYIEIFDKNQILIQSQSMIGNEDKVFIQGLKSDTYYVKLYNNGHLLKTDRILK